MAAKKYALVDLSEYGFVIEPRYWFYGWSQSGVVKGRESLAKMLAEARRALPKGCNFKVWDCHRPLIVQTRMIASFRKRLAAAHPDLHGEEFEKLVFTFASKPKRVIERMDHHRHGGAIDLTIVDAEGLELCMGTDHDDLTPRAALDYFETEANVRSVLDREARDNRRLLKKAMRSANFGSYAPEWWHWDTTT